MYWFSVFFNLFCAIALGCILLVRLISIILINRAGPTSWAIMPESNLIFLCQIQSKLPGEDPRSGGEAICQGWRKEEGGAFICHLFSTEAIFPLAILPSGIKYRTWFYVFTFGLGGWKEEQYMTLPQLIRFDTQLSFDNDWIFNPTTLVGNCVVFYSWKTCLLQLNISGSDHQHLVPCRCNSGLELGGEVPNSFSRIKSNFPESPGLKVIFSRVSDKKRFLGRTRLKEILTRLPNTPPKNK